MLWLHLLQVVGKTTATPKKGVVRVLLVLIILGVTLAGLDIAASRFGRDSRDGDDWFSHSDVFEVANR